MTQQYQQLSLEYAQAVQQYAALDVLCRTSTDRNDAAAMRVAFNVMVDAQNALYRGALALAEAAV